MFRSLGRAFAVAITALVLSEGAYAADETILYRFQGGRDDGANPDGSLSFGPDGALYGAAQFGGSAKCAVGQAIGCGVIFKLSPPNKVGGQWTETLIHKFTDVDGSNPQSPPLFLSNGKIYGSAGSIYQLIEPQTASGTWGFKLLVSQYTGGNLIGLPGGVLLGSDRDRTEEIFKIAFDKSGSPTRTVLHQFTYPLDGHGVAGLVAGGGSVFGATYSGGNPNPNSSDGFGLAFAVDIATGKETILERFSKSTGWNSSGLIKDASANLYGVLEADYGVPNNSSNGVAYRLSPPLKGTTKWAFTRLHTFKSSEGAPYGQPTLVKGVLYGTASSPSGDFGIIYALKPPLKGQTEWRYSVVYNFEGGDDSANSGPLVADSKGRLYGMSQAGGGKKCHYSQYQIGCGTVFMITP